jgi:hypothetical protein
MGLQSGLYARYLAIDSTSMPSQPAFVLLAAARTSTSACLPNRRLANQQHCGEGPCEKRGHSHPVPPLPEHEGAGRPS